MKQSLLTLPVIATILPIALAAPRLTHRAAICGSKGYDAGTDGYGYTHNGTYAGCSVICQRDPVHCKSFSYGDGSCNLYNVAVAGNFERDSSSPYTFYDIACLAAPSSTTSTSIAKTSSTTTTMTKVATFTTSTRSGTALTVTTTSKSTSSVITTSATTKSPSKAAPTTTTTSTTSIAASSATPPCALPTWTIHDFTFFNSSHNLDCAGADAGSNLCSTGLPAQPAGYGPPDSVSATVDGIGACHQQNPGSVPLRAIGDNVVRCAGSQKQLTFYGNSNSASGVARFDVQNQVVCDNGATYAAYGSVQVAMECDYDSGRNATCTISPASVSVPATSFDSVAYPS